jgi:hypothetical protein
MAALAHCNYVYSLHNRETIVDDEKALKVFAKLFGS